MKASLIVRLIQAHSCGEESGFERALLDLANDEERKGNASLALTLKETYFSNKKTTRGSINNSKSAMLYSAQNTGPVPKNRDNTLELLEILNSSVRLSDIALTQKTYEILKQIIDEQKKATNLTKKGITPTNRVLFCGPPGCGKTLAANALAGELNLPIAYIKLDGLVSSYLGQTGTNIRKIFEFVKDKRIMLFLDEFDAIAKKRDDSHELGELKRVVTTLLQNLDSMPSNVFLVAATNHHHLLDPAIWRRFDVSILMELPNTEQRRTIIEKFLKEYLENYKVDINSLIVLTDGMSGAQINSLMQSLAKHCVLNKIKNISIEDIASAWLKHTTLFISEDSEQFIKALAELRKNGVSVRALEKATGIPKSTIDYRLKKEVKKDE